MDKTFNRFGRITRETPCSLEYNNGDGKVHKEEVLLRFVSLTTAEIRDRQKKAVDRRKKDETPWLSEELVGVLTEIVESDGTAHKVTGELLDTLAVENVLAMSNAINDAIRPKDQPAK